MIFKKNTLEKTLKDIQIPVANINFKQAFKDGLLSIQEDNKTINLSFVLPQHLLQQLQEKINQAAGEKIKLAYHIHTHKTQPNLQPLKNIKNIIAVTAGKGGVGKSTVSVNIAAALAAMGAKVGLLDADIYGPNQPQLCGVDLSQTELQTKDNQFIPIEQHCFKHISIGYLIDQSQPAIWRGPMATKALSQLCFQTQWGELDYLVIDMPPGTGDIPLTLAQKIPVTGAVIVATPQALALSDIDKSMAMLNKVHIPILGVVENMSLYICSACGHKEAIFSHHHSTKLCERFNKPLLTQIPLDQDIDQSSENGLPIALKEDNVLGCIFVNLATKISLEIASQPRDYRVQFPKIVVE